jgi:hypothetical protein
MLLLPWHRLQNNIAISTYYGITLAIYLRRMPGLPPSRRDVAALIACLQITVIALVAVEFNEPVL